MSKKSNPALIGGFVVGAVALLAVGVSVFGGAQYFQKKSQTVAYFEGSVKGLRVGSNVLFRGVRVGYVDEIQLIGDAGTLQPVVRTVMELAPDAWLIYEDGVPISGDADELISSEQLVEAGLRARLGTESIVTGQLVVELDFLPNSEAVMRAIKDEKLREIPTVPTNVQQVLGQLQKFFEDLDFDKLADDLQGLISGLDDLANSRDAREALSGLNQFANNEDFQQLPGTLRSTLAEARSAVAKFGELSANLDAEVGPVVTELKTALEKLDGALDSAHSAFDAVERQVGGETGLDYEVSSTLREVRETARSLRVLTDYLQNNPEALIRGKK